MPKSLAELRASQSTSLPERSYSLCLASGLVAEVQALLSELDTLAVPRTDEGEAAGPPRRMGDPRDVRRSEIDARMAELWTEIDDHTGELRIRAIRADEWAHWVDEHPARKDNDRDEGIAFGLCNADDLVADLGRYAASWNGAPLEDGDWAYIAGKASRGDLKQIARTVVVMHEQAADLGKFRQASLGILVSGSASVLPEPSESAPDDSTDGNLPSDTSTTTPTAT